MLYKMIKRLEYDFELYQDLQSRLDITDPINDSMFAFYSGKLDIIRDYYKLLLGE